MNQASLAGRCYRVVLIVTTRTGCCCQTTAYYYYYYYYCVIPTDQTLDVQDDQDAKPPVEAVEAIAQRVRTSQRR